MGYRSAYRERKLQLVEINIYYYKRKKNNNNKQFTNFGYKFLLETYLAIMNYERMKQVKLEFLSVLNKEKKLKNTICDKKNKNI